MAEYGLLLNNLAGLYKAMGLYDEALDLFKQSLNNTALNYGTEHPEYSTTLNNIAELYWKLGEYGWALKGISEITRKLMKRPWEKTTSLMLLPLTTWEVFMKAWD